MKLRKLKEKRLKIRELLEPYKSEGYDLRSLTFSLEEKSIDEVKKDVDNFINEVSKLKNLHKIIEHVNTVGYEEEYAEIERLLKDPSKVAEASQSVLVLTEILEREAVRREGLKKEFGLWEKEGFDIGPLKDSDSLPLHAVEELYAQWNNATTEEREGFVEKIVTAFDEIEEEYSGTYAHQRGLFMMGDFYFTNEDWENSLDKYLALAGSYSESYLAPVALYNAAAACEELGDNERALENYRRISDEYSESALAPRSLFSVGRLEEQISADQALSAYNELIESYPQSNWTKLARSRIIELNISK